MFDPILFQNTTYKNADGLVLFCKELLEKKGLTVEAEKLAGYDGINDELMARAALRALSTVKVPDDQNLREYVRITQDMLLKAAGMLPLRHAC